VVVVFGALVQAGVLMPKFKDGNDGAGGTTSSSVEQAIDAHTVENQSLRSWTITGLQFPTGRSESLPDGSTVHIGGVYQGANLDSVVQGNSRAVTPPLTIGPGQQITVKLVRDFPPVCRQRVVPRSLAQIHRLEAVRFPQLHDLSVDIVVRTPLGSRMVATTFSVVYGCDGA
jgi:hypothetical protein